MGAFGYYTGGMIISPEKKEEFAEAVKKIFYYGGMMKLETVSLYDKEIHLLEPVKYESGMDVDFYYNYFEDTWWENAGYDNEEQRIYSNKIGSFEFSDVIAAAYVLYEHYDEEIGLTIIDEDICNCSFSTGWINNILGTNYSIKHRFRIWNLAEEYALSRKDYSNPICYRDVMGLLPKKALKYAGGIELTDLLYIIEGTESLVHEEVEEGSYAADVLACKDAIMESLLIYGEETGKNKIITLIKKKYADRENEKELTELAKLSLYIPARVFMYLLCEKIGKPFWEEWDDIRAEVYCDEKMKSYASSDLEKWRKEGRKRPIAPVSTSEYLKQDRAFAFWNTPDELKREPRYYLSDMDRLYWWDGSKEVIIDEKTEKWLNYTKEQFLENLGKIETEYDAMTYMKKMIDLLHEINKRYGRVYAFKEMYYEFMANGYKKEYRAAIALLEKLYNDNMRSGIIIEKLRGWELESKTAKCNKGRMNVKRYLSLLANNQLRMKYLGF